MCPKLPEISNGFIIDASQRYFFGDEARVQCHKGFKLVGGSNIIRCGPDQAFLNPPKCEGNLYSVLILDQVLFQCVGEINVKQYYLK